MGLQIIYAFVNDQLVKIIYTLSPNVCKQCKAEYYFKEVFHKKESGIKFKKVTELFNDAQTYQSNAPKRLPFGYYEIEDCIHGR
jgi:hypothetical protein